MAPDPGRFLIPMRRAKILFYRQELMRSCFNFGGKNASAGNVKDEIKDVSGRRGSDIRDRLKW